MVKFLPLKANTIGDLYTISNSLPAFHLPKVNLEIIGQSASDAFTIAILAAIESLLSCVVADGMINGKHRSDMELVAQGAGNIASALFGGIPATGAIAKNCCQHQKRRSYPDCRNGTLHYTGHRSCGSDAICRADSDADYRSSTESCRRNYHDFIIPADCFILTSFVNHCVTHG